MAAGTESGGGGKASANNSDTTLRVAVLDDYGDLATDVFSAIPGVSVTQLPDTVDTSGNMAAQIQRLEAYAVISTMRERTAFPAGLISQLPRLKLLLTSGPRNAAIDTSAAAQHGVLVHGTMGSDSSFRPRHSAPGASATTQHTLALMLALASNIAADDYIVKRGGWQTGYVTLLGGKTLALLGLGRLGAEMARICVQSFGMRVVAWSPNLTQARADHVAAQHGLPAASYRVVSKTELFAAADVLSLHVVLSERTRHLVGPAELALMKPSALLINTSRGALVDEKALHETLLTGRIRGCAMDVFWLEPLADDSPWRTTHWGTSGSSQVILSPHMGYVVEETMRSWYEEQAENLKAWIKGDTESMTSKLDNSGYA